jgi:uncharacterized membrane protein
MTVPSVILGTPRWLTAVVALAAIAYLLVLWSYARARTKPSVRFACGLLKAIGIGALALALLEPLLTGTRPRKGANAFAVVADNSQSLQIRDGAETRARGDWVREQLLAHAPWKTRLGQDFDVRNYVFDSHLRSVEGFDGLAFDGAGSAIAGSLTSLAKRFHGLPLAGVLLFTDGNHTDAGDIDWKSLPPVYPVVPPARGVARDVGIREVSISQTNFESAPVILRVDVSITGFTNQTIVAAVTDESGIDVERQRSQPSADGKHASFRFQFRPQRRGVSFYTVRAFPASEDLSAGPHAPAPASSEQTLANNRRLVVVDQGGGPYRILYVSGRPNWEYKFIRRALREDEQIELSGLIRIARRQPKFDFQAKHAQRQSPLFEGFDRPDAETADAADQPVLIPQINAEGELRDGFPKSPAELYGYHAVIIDDLESGFFSQDQHALVRNFVSARGGGLLMLGGPDTFADGKYDRTPIGELLPVYLKPGAAVTGMGEYRLLLTREGWLQPWVRVRKTEADEEKRLAEMPPFHTLTRAGTLKPGAVALAEVADVDGSTVPALLAQPFGKGRVGALLIGDFWRWGMRREAGTESDLERAWRQVTRWLVSDVPSRVEMTVRPKTDSASQTMELAVRVRDLEYRPMDNAKVALKISLPGGAGTLALDAEPDGREAGLYAASYAPKQPGAYRVLATATAPDGAAIGEREGGWAVQPAADEFARLEPDREYLKTIAAKTGGEVVDGANLGSFVASLSSRRAPISEPWTSPLWHQPWYFLITIVCLTAEWGLRRVSGLV